MRKALITGINGQDGSYLAELLLEKGYEVCGILKRNSVAENQTARLDNIFNQLNLEYADMTDMASLIRVLQLFKPDEVYNLAAQSHVRISFDQPIYTTNVVALGTLNLLESIRGLKSIKSVVVITTDKVYKISKNNKSYKELDELGGYDPYSSSKVCTEIVVDSYIKSFFKNTGLQNKISTARAGNVIGGGDFSKYRLIPDIIYAINNNTKLNIRNPNHIRPWQHVLDPLMGYLILAEKQFKNKINNDQHAWNFGPSKNSFKKVIDIVKHIKKSEKLKYTLIKRNKFKETNVLKLNSLKAKNKLNWVSKWNLSESLAKTLEWNSDTRKGTPLKNMCERQFLMHINKK